jgi:hypothetical protein
MWTLGGNGACPERQAGPCDEGTADAGSAAKAVAADLKVRP